MQFGVSRSVLRRKWREPPILRRANPGANPKLRREVDALGSRSIHNCALVNTGLALALGTLYLLAFTDKAMYSERDIELSLKLPVLAMVPSFDVSAHRVYRHQHQPMKSSSRLATRI